MPVDLVLCSVTSDLDPELYAVPEAPFPKYSQLQLPRLETPYP